MTTIIYLSTLLALTLFSSFTFAQSDPKVKTNRSDSEVRINLRVTNSDDYLVNDVELKDIKLYEDGLEQHIAKLEKRLPLNMGIVVDNSGSMRRRLSEAGTAGATLVANMSDGDEAFVVRFVSRDKVSIEQDWTLDKNELRGPFQNAFVEGGQSSVIDALYLSAEKIVERARKDPSKRYALVLISDGEERDSYYQFKDVMKMLDGSGVQVFSIALIDPKFSSETKIKSEGLTQITR